VFDQKNPCAGTDGYASEGTPRVGSPQEVAPSDPIDFNDTTKEEKTLSIKKTLMIAGLLASGVMATLGLQQVQAAGKNGDGIVYHRSDCSSGYVLSPAYISKVHQADHNWRLEEIEWCEIYWQNLVPGSYPKQLCDRRD
jgi:hypothetical protein